MASTAPDALRNMAEFVIRADDDRGHLLEQVEQGHTELEVRERFAQQGYLVYSVKARGLLSSAAGARPQRLAIGFRKKLVSSLVYPALLFVLVIGMLIFLITYVVPQFANLYSQLEAELPPLTMFMLSVGVSVQQNFVWILLGVAVVVVAF